MQQLIKKYAIGAVFHDTDNLGFDFIMEKLEEGEIPDEVLVWTPYESLNASQLAERVEEQFDIFATFAVRLSETGENE